MLGIILAGIFTIGVIIFIHELGHFLAARSVGIHVHRFSIGLGPVLLRWRAFSTEWALSLLPFGGYVKMAGMVEAVMEGELPEEEQNLPAEKLFRNKTVPQRLLVIIAGPAANLILALLLSIGLAYHAGEPILPGTFLDGPAPGSPAEEAGIQRGDRILSWNGQDAENWTQLSKLINASEERTFHFVLEREGNEIPVSLDLFDEAGEPVRMGISPAMDTRVGNVLKDGPADQVGLLRGDRILSVNGRHVMFFEDIASIINAIPGEEAILVWEREGEMMEGTTTVLSADVPDPDNEGKLMKAGRIFYEPYNDWRPFSAGEALRVGGDRVVFWSQLTLGWLGKMVTGQGDKDSVGGPIAIFKAAGEMARWGFSRLLIFIAFFSTQLFLLNLLPIPVLDGGHVVFLALEGVGRPLSEEWRVRLTTVGMFLILGLMGWIVLLDVLKIF